MRGSSVVAVTMLVLGMTILVPGNGQLSSPERVSALTATSGDIDCDGSLTAGDVLEGLRAISGVNSDTCLEQNADVNCSGSGNMADLLQIRRHLAGLSVELPGGCPAIGSPTNEGPVSELPTSQLIEDALASGSITKGSALLYHLYAGLDPRSLPSAFRGTGDAHLEGALFQEIGAAWSTLSSAEKAALQPFLLPPAANGSWAQEPGFQAQGVQWETVSNSRIKVWWQTQRPEDAAKAAAILQELDTYIWPGLVTYMGGEERAPLSDLGQPGSGGDGKYDVYLVHNAPHDPGKKPVLGWVSPTLDAQGNLKCELTPTYMVLNSRVPLTPEFFSTVAHEFAHSVQFTYDVGDCYDYRWLMESTATWVESWLYPQVNQEHGFAGKYLEQIDQQPLEHWAFADDRQYGSYLLWYHAQYNEGRFYAVRDVWAASTAPDSLVAVNTALSSSGGLRDVWPKSALYNWNREPYEAFTARDLLPFAAPWVDTEVSAGNAPISYPVPTDVGHMQQRHLNYTIDSNVKTLTFINSFSGNYDYYAKVQALVAINGEWKSEALDWTNEDRVSFCLDKPEEKVTQLVIIITNSNYLDRSNVLDAGPGELVASPGGCKGWTGSVTATIPHYDTTFHITVDNLRFAPDEENPGNETYDFYELVEAGDATWTVSGTWFETCVPSGTMTLKPPKTDPTAIGGFLHVDKRDNSYNVNVSGNTYEDTLIITCANDEWTRSWPVSQILWDGAMFRPIPDDGVISEEYSEPKPAYGGTWTWNLTRVE